MENGQGVGCAWIAEDCDQHTTAADERLVDVSVMALESDPPERREEPCGFER
jgi:hypothetical protein